MYVRVYSLECFYEGQSSASKKEKIFHHDWWSHALILADTTARLERWPAHLLSRTSPVSARKPSLKIGFPGAKRWKSCWESSVWYSLELFQVSTGTTLVAVEFDGGVVIGADSRTSMVTFCLILASELFQLSSGHLGRQQGDWQTHPSHRQHLLLQVLKTLGSQF